MLPIVQTLQGEEFPDIPHRQLQMLHVRQLPEASRYLQIRQTGDQWLGWLGKYLDVGITLQEFDIAMEYLEHLLNL